MHFFPSTEQKSETFRALYTKPIHALGAIRKKSIHQKLKPTFPYFGSPTLDTDNYAPLGGGRYDEWKHGDTPYPITPQDITASDDLARKRRTAIQAAMKHAWSGYRNNAFGYDELQPVSGKGNMNWNGIGTTIVDSMDTLWLMGMKEEFYECRDWVRDHLSHDKKGFVSVFETTIRNLGGLLSAYDWSGDDTFLEKAVDLGDRLLKAFDSPSGIPYSQVDLKSGKAANKWNPHETTIAQAGTLQIEFRYLSKMTGNKTYAEKADYAFELLRSLKPRNGLYITSIRNTYIRPMFGEIGKVITFGGSVDSFYEYMLKLWLQSGKTESKFREMYDQSIEGMHNVLLQYTKSSGLAYISKRNTKFRRLIREFEHLECFMGGLLALGAHTDPLGPDSERAKRDMKTAKALTYTCYQMYATTPTGLGPESASFYSKGENQTEYDLRPKHNQAYYLLRPEVVESMYVLNKISGDPIYREMGWEIFQSIEKFCKTSYGYGAYPDVRNATRAPNDSMESFFLGETLKYLYLLMDPDSEVDLDKYVFNTEAHPLKYFHMLT